MELHTDIYYIEKILAGDVSCFGIFLDRYDRQVYTLIFRIVGNKEDAEELTQDVFMKAFRSLNSFKRESKFSTWLYRIAYNTAISETRKRKQEVLSFDESRITNVSEEDVNNVIGNIDNTEQIEMLETALMILPTEERALILLFYMQEKSVEEIAEISGLSISNVKTRLFRIRKKLYVLLTKKED